MENNETLTDSIRKQIYFYTGQINDMKKRVVELKEMIKQNDDAAAAEITKKYAGKYFADIKNCPKDSLSTKILKVKNFSQKNGQWTVNGTLMYVYADISKNFADVKYTVGIRESSTILTTKFDPSIEEAVSIFEDDYSEVTMEEVDQCKAKISKILTDL